MSQHQPEPQAERGDPAAEQQEMEALERHWAAWNDPVLIEHRAADAAAEAESERIWQENRIGLRGSAAQHREVQAENEPQVAWEEPSPAEARAMAEERQPDAGPQAGPEPDAQPEPELPF